MNGKSIAIILLVLTGVSGAGTSAAAQGCGPDSFAQLVDDTGARLRRANERSEREMRADFEQLAKRKGWPADNAVEKGFDYLQDERTRTLDQQASELLIRLDVLSDTETKPATCARLDDLKVAAKQLLEVTDEKRAHIKAKLAVALRPKLKAPPAQPTEKASRPTQQSTSELRQSAYPSAKTAKPGDTDKQQVRPRNKTTARAGKHWSTTTTTSPPPGQDVMAALPPVVAQEQDQTFAAREIRAAGRDLFGSISSELAAVIKFAFDSYGKPNGYVLGTEGGAAFLAGLRYGHGELVSKRFGKRKIYWQGPSIGTDFGITGSRVLMLVYNLDDPNQIFKRFVGVEGAAYLVGGVGITFHKKGRLVLAPIRTGLGLRLGANVGYLKITPQRRFNPF